MQDAKDLAVIASFENHRLSVLNLFLGHADNVDAAYAYAMDKRVAPINHQALRELHGFDPFAGAYFVEAEVVDQISQYLDNNWNEPDKLRFREIENSFGGHHSKRMELVYAIRYFKLSGLFDGDVYSAILKDAPVESHSIGKPYGPDQVLIG